VFAAAGVAHPATVLGPDASCISGAVVVKPRRGGGGAGVRLERTAPSGLADDVLVQRFVEGEEYRVTVVGGRDYGWARKAPAAGDFRGNLARGATMTSCEAPSRAARATAIAAVAALGLDLAGVDLIWGADGATIVEVNAATTLFGPTVDATTAIVGAVCDLVQSVLASKLQM
jgi:ribosomal protein S6--L-glutamate ligase